jgi:hypothetical protein
MGQVQQVIGALSGAPIRTYGEERSGYTGQVLGEVHHVWSSSWSWTLLAFLF